MRTLICIQARMSSTRLPGKVMLPLAGAPLLVRMVERVRAARIPAVFGSTTIAVITSTDPADDAIARLCSEERIPLFRGHPTDLLERHYAAALHFGAEANAVGVVAKIPSDCPLIDPQIIERVFNAFAREAFKDEAFKDEAIKEAGLTCEMEIDYLSNLHPASYPDGNDVEVMTTEALRRARELATRPFEREHTTPYIWEHPGDFRIGNVVWDPAAGSSNLSMTHRWTIDYPEDYEFIAKVYDALWTPTTNKEESAERPIFGMEDILDLLERDPALREINARYAGVNWYRHHLSELTTITADDTRLPEAERASRTSQPDRTSPGPIKGTHSRAHSQSLIPNS